MQHNFADKICPICNAVGSFTISDDNTLIVCASCFTPFSVDLPRNDALVQGPVPPAPTPTYRDNGLVVDYVTRKDVVGNKMKIEVSRQYVKPEKDPPSVVFNPKSPQVEWVLYYYKDKIRNRRRYNRNIIRKHKDERNSSVT